MDKKKISIIVSYRNREQHLNQFVPYMNKFLADIPHKIHIIEQYDEKPFNRAKLFNIGFDIDHKEFDYFCFHDIDMLPLEADYSFVEKPYHMATNASQFNNNLPYQTYYGGVNLFNKEDFIKINGYSNDFWGWGGEDDDLLKRVRLLGFDLYRRKGVYKSLPHTQNGPNHINHKDNVKKLNSNYDIHTDGINSLTYKHLSTENKGEYFLTKVSL
jgi:predicted glycosyltransferase involved in capsule biosynthesis